MDTTCIVGTDIASFLLYEPEALQHRASSPWGWFYDFSDSGGDLGSLTVPERADGRLVCIDTAIPVYLEDQDRVMWVGSDGGYLFRCTTGGLTPDEAEREYPETRERLEPQPIHVTHERLLLDGGSLIPYDHTPGFQELSFTDALEKALVALLVLPSGTYRVTAHYLAPSDEDEEANDEVSIVLTFDRLE